jgi:two-component sensor histidine kinase
MEHLLYLLPARPQPAFVRYGATTIIVLVCFLLQIGVQYQSAFFALFLFLPGIFLGAVLFDRGSGFYATALSTLLSLVAINPSSRLGIAPQQIVPVVLFVLIGLAIATVSEALRSALERAQAAEQALTLRLEELNHRIRNNLAIITSVLELQARSHKEEQVKLAFASAVGRVNVIANAHDHLLPQDPHASIEMREYLTRCCQNLGDALRDVRPIAVNVDVANILLRSDKAVAIGMIVNELVTNAFKHAFPGDRAGAVTVSLQPTNPKELTLIVEDDGTGCPPNAEENLGSRIIRLLVRQVGATMKMENANPGCRAVVILPKRATPTHAA